MDGHLIRLDLACGDRKKPGFLGVDIAQCGDVDVIHDLAVYPWPFADNSVSEVYCSHFVEHHPDLIAFMHEVWRVCQDGARVEIIHPHWSSVRCWQDPTHVRAINENSWHYYNQEWLKSQKLDHYPITCNFKIVDVQAILAEPWDTAPEKDREFAMRHYINVVSDLIVVLEVLK